MPQPPWSSALHFKTQPLHRRPSYRRWETLQVHVAVICDRPENVLVHKPSWVADGFRARSHTVEMVHDLASIRRADEQCDLLVFDHKAAGVSRAALVQLSRQPRRAVWVQWWRDLIATDPQARLADQPFMRSFGDVMRGMDLVLVKERSLLDDYRQLGINAAWLDQACPGLCSEKRVGSVERWDSRAVLWRGEHPTPF